MNDEIPIRQLIYTNVEADQSPTRQRGFQIWQWSRDLTLEQRKLIAKRLEDYRLPPGTSAKDGEKVHRYIFCRPAENFNVVARTVPLDEKDKFGRGGKFFAHAIVLADDDFKKIGCNPFYIFHSGFRFANSPREIIDQRDDDEWKSGELRDRDLLIPPAKDLSQAPLVHEQLEERHLKIRYLISDPGDRTIVLPYATPRVMAELQEVFSLLPNTFRHQLEFDTLTNGSSLQQIKYRIVGSYSLDALRLWSFRRYVKLDLEKVEFNPKVDVKPVGVPLAVIFEPQWRDLSEEDRKVLFEICDKLICNSASSFSEMPAFSATLNAALDSSHSIKEALTNAIEKRRSSEIPEAIALLPAVSRMIQTYFSDPPSKLIPHLSRPIPHDLINEALLQELLGNPKPKPSVDVLQELSTRSRKGGLNKLEWILRRWRATAEDLREIEEELGSIEGGDSWLREWIVRTLPEEFESQGNAAPMLSKLAKAQAFPKEQLINSRVYLATLHDRAQPHWLTAKLNLSLAWSKDEFDNVLRLHQNSTFVHEWLRDQVVRALRGNWVAGWANDGMKLQIGLFLDAKSQRDRAIVDAFIDHGRDARYLFEQLWPGKIYSKTPEGSHKEEKPLSDGCKNAFAQLLKADALDRRSSVNRLRELLKHSDNSSFSWVANNLLESGGGRWVLRIENDENGNNEVGFVGLVLTPIIMRAWLNELFEAVAGSMVAEVTIGKALPGRHQLESLYETRFSWFISRVANNAETQRMPLN